MLRGLRAEPSLAYAASQHRYDGGMVAWWHGGMVACWHGTLRCCRAWWHGGMLRSIFFPAAFCCQHAAHAEAPAPAAAAAAADLPVFGA